MGTCVLHFEVIYQRPLYQRHLLMCLSNCILRHRKIVLFGVGSIASKTFRILSDKKIDAIIDNASNLWGEFDQGVEVLSPDFLLKANKKSINVRS